MPCWIADKDGIRLSIRVTPRSSRDAITVSADGERFAVRLNAPPVDGAANAALIAFLASTFSVPKRAVAILSGAGAREKRVSITGDVATLAATARKLYGAKP